MTVGRARAATVGAGAGALPDGPRGLLAVDRLLVAYLGITGLLALALGGLAGLALAGVHALAAGAIALMARWPARRGPGGLVRGAYPVLLTPVLYAELAVLNRFVTERYFDATVQGWEAALFAGQPSMSLSAGLPWLPVSEFLHLGYVAYYAIVPAALIGVYVTRGFGALQRTALGVAAAFFVSYLIFIFFPVAGPRYEFARIGGEISDGTLYGLVHAILESGSSKGTAFPSSHIAASFAAIACAGREDRRWFWLLVIPELALAVGTVYGRFHYAVDAVAGLALGMVVWAANPALARALRGRQPEAEAGYPTK